MIIGKSSGNRFGNFLNPKAPHDLLPQHHHNDLCIAWKQLVEVSFCNTVKSTYDKVIWHLPRINQPSRINNIFGKTERFRRFRPQGESDGWADLFIGSPYKPYCIFSS
jgi:hypothetical protein